MRNSLIVFLILIAANSLSAQSVSTFARFDSVSVGDIVPFGITIKKDREYSQILFPDTSHFAGLVEIVERKRFRINAFTDSMAYRLQYFGNKDLDIPRLPVRLVLNNDTMVVYSDPTFFPFKSNLKENPDDNELKPLKPIFYFARIIWPYLLALLVLGIIGYFIWKKLKNRKPVEEAPKVIEIPVFENPITWLEGEIARLRADEAALLAQRDFKQFYIELGDAMRSYYEKLYQIKAMESTSRELLYELNRLAVFEDQVRLTQELLRRADLIKFAKLEVTLDQAYSDLQEADRFVLIARKVDSSRITRMKMDFQVRHGLVESQAPQTSQTSQEVKA